MAALVLSFGGFAVAAQAEAGVVHAAGSGTTTLVADNPGDQSGNVGITIRLQLTCSGGYPPCSWTATGLPAGLTINSSGLISGTPTTGLKPSNVTVTAKDTRNATSSASFTWYLTRNVTAFNPGDQTNPVGTAINPVQLYCFGGTPPCIFNVTGLPPGLSLGHPYQVVGTPTTAGVYTVNFTVTDIYNKKGSTSWTWTVTAP